MGNIKNVTSLCFWRVSSSVTITVGLFKSKKHCFFLSKHEIKTKDHCKSTISKREQSRWAIWFTDPTHCITAGSMAAGGNFTMANGYILTTTHLQHTTNNHFDSVCMQAFSLSLWLP